MAYTFSKTDRTYLDVSDSQINRDSEKDYVVLTGQHTGFTWYENTETILYGCLNYNDLNRIVNNIKAIYDEYSIAIPSEYSSISTKTFSEEGFLQQADFNLIVNALNYLIDEASAAGYIARIDDYVYESNYLDYNDINLLELKIDSVYRGSGVWNITLPENAFTDYVAFYYKKDNDEEWNVWTSEEIISAFKIQFKIIKNAENDKQTTISDIYEVYRDIEDLIIGNNNHVFSLESRKNLSESGVRKTAIFCGNEEFLVFLPENSYSDDLKMFYNTGDGNGWRNWEDFRLFFTPKIKFKMSDGIIANSENENYFELDGSVDDLTITYTESTKEYRLRSRRDLNFDLYLTLTESYTVTLPENQFENLTCYYRINNSISWTEWKWSKQIQAYQIAFMIKNKTGGSTGEAVSKTYTVSQNVGDLSLVSTDNNFVLSSTILGMSITVVNDATPVYTLYLPANPYAGQLALYYQIGETDPVAWLDKTSLAVEEGQQIRFIAEGNRNPGVGKFVTVNSDVNDFTLTRENYYESPYGGYYFEFASLALAFQISCIYLIEE